MPLPSTTLIEFLNDTPSRAERSMVWRRREDIPANWYEHVFNPSPPQLFSGLPPAGHIRAALDYITPIEKGKEWLLALTCEHQPRTGKLLMEGSELVVRAHESRYGRYSARMAIEVHGKVILLYRLFAGRNPSDENYEQSASVLNEYQTAMPPALWQAYYTRFCGMSLLPEPPVSIYCWALPKDVNSFIPIDHWLDQYRGAKKKYLPWFDARFPELMPRPRDNGTYFNFRCWLDTRIVPCPIRDFTPAEQATIDRKDPVDALFIRTDMANSPVYHVEDAKLDEMTIVADPAEAVDRYCEHVLLGKEGRFDFSPWLVPLD